MEGGRARRGLEVDRDREVAVIGDGHRYRVAYQASALGYGDGLGAGEGHLARRTGPDRTTGSRKGNLNVGDLKRSVAEGVGQLEANLWAADADVDSLTYGLAR